MPDNFDRHTDARRGAFTVSWSWPAALLGPLWYLRFGLWELSFVYSGMVLILVSQFGVFAIPVSFLFIAALFKYDFYRYRSARLENEFEGSVADLMHPGVSLAEFRMAAKRGWISDAEYASLVAAYDARETVRASAVLRADAFGQELSHTKNLRLRREYRERFGLRDETAAAEWGEDVSGANLIETKS